MKVDHKKKKVVGIWNQILETCGIGQFFNIEQGFTNMWPSKEEPSPKLHPLTLEYPTLHNYSCIIL